MQTFSIEGSNEMCKCFVVCGAKEVLAVGGGGNVYAFYMGVVVMVVVRSRVVVVAAGESERKL